MINLLFVQLYLGAKIVIFIYMQVVFVFFSFLNE